MFFSFKGQNGIKMVKLIIESITFWSLYSYIYQVLRKQIVNSNNLFGLAIYLATPCQRLAYSLNIWSLLID